MRAGFKVYELAGPAQDVITQQVQLRVYTQHESCHELYHLNPEPPLSFSTCALSCHGSTPIEQAKTIIGHCWWPKAFISKATGESGFYIYRNLLIILGCQNPRVNHQW